MPTGYTTPLYILPFDHRGSFLKKLYGTSTATAEQTTEIAHLKWIIYKGFCAAIESGNVPKGNAAILVDEQFGDAVLRDAKTQGYMTAVCTEKSGQDEYDFEYGDGFIEHIEQYQPTFVKALLRYNPDGDPALNARQRQHLKKLSDYCQSTGYKFLIEPLIPATEQQLASVGEDERRYDTEIRPGLAIRMIQELQDGGVDVDIWKIEGMEEPERYQETAAQARRGGRGDVGIIVLGRGSDTMQVEHWLTAGRNIPGVIGFAIGRTIFWEPIISFRDGKITEEAASQEIANRYSHFYRVFTGQ